MYRNDTGINLPLAVWLAADDGYDLVPDPNIISATSLLKPLKSLVLARRATEESDIDIFNLIPSRLGTAVHTAVEIAWLSDYKTAMLNLGYPQSVVDKIRINPEKPVEDAINIYLEQRKEKQIEGFTISGKFDIVVDGQLSDIKNTSTYTYIKGSNDRKYALQGSIYRWLNPDIISEDYLNIEYVFNDWSSYKAASDPQYPSNRVITKSILLLSLEETERYIKDRLTQLKQLDQLPQDELPRCTREDLWQDRSRWAYYRNPANRKRATKIFDLEADAMKRHADDGMTGLVEERKGEPTYCRFCDARQVCQQAEQYVLEGILKI